MRPIVTRPVWQSVAGVLAVLAVGLAVRVQPWSEVFPPDRSGATFLGDTDTYYHGLRAVRIAENYPSVPWRDDRMNFPLGSDILWPPLFDHAVATVAFLADAGEPTRVTVERVAALLPPLLGVVTVGLVAALGFVLLGRGPWIVAALLFALLPAHAEFSVVGRPDQHVAELLLQTLVMLSFAAAWAGERGTASRWLLALALGGAIALSFWNWQGSALYLMLIGAFAGVWHLIDVDGRTALGVQGALARGTAIGAALLLVSIVLWGRPGAVSATSLSGVNGIQALLTALVALYAFGSCVALRWRQGASKIGRRALEVVAAAAIPLAAAWIVVPGLRSGVGQGLSALTAGDPWYASIREFQPPLFGGRGIGRELAAWIPRFPPLFLMPPAALGLLRVWRRRPERRAAVIFLAVWGVLLLLATLARLRFTLYLSVPAVLWTALALREAVGLAGGRGGRRAAGAAGLLVVLAPALFYFSHGGLRRDPTHTEVIAALEWLRDRPDANPRRPAVFSEWDWGHLIQYFGSRPTVASPFGVDGGPGALEDTAAFFLTTSPEEASRILTKRRAGWLLLVDPLTHAAESAAWAPPGTRSPVAIEWRAVRGPQMSVDPAVDDLVAIRVYYDCGLSSRGLPTLARYRLVYEGSPEVPRQVRLFEVVPGATLSVHGALPGAVVRAAVDYRTSRNRTARWTAEVAADGEGRASLDVPFSTGENGTVAAGAYRVDCGGGEAGVKVPATAVERGETIEVRCVAGEGGGR